MALPTLSKTWQFNLNSVYAVGSEQPRYTMLGLKNALESFSLSPWQVVASSNSSSVRNIGYVGDPDLWSTYTNLVWGSGAHSWIVLKQPGLDSGGNAMLCIDLNNASGSPYCSVFMSLDGYNADGTTSARPTTVSSQAFTVLNNTAWGTYYDPTYGSYAQRLQVMQSTDGECTRIFIMRNGAVGMWSIEKAKNPRAEWTRPVFSVLTYGCSQANSDWLTTENICTTSSSYLKSYINGSGASGYLIYPCYGAGSSKISCLNGSFPDEPSGEWPLLDIGLFFTTPDRRGFKGSIYDMWWTDVFQKGGNLYPDDGSKQFACMNQLVTPWDGTSKFYTS